MKDFETEVKDLPQFDFECFKKLWTFEGWQVNIHKID